jgi:endogenous inhibitor of DNA gyrase (YacG/DUF329 family)
MMSKDGTYEHRDVWESINGKIPSDHHIHHKNMVRSDNRVENLECIQRDKHLRMHGLTYKMLNHLTRLRNRAPVKRFVCVTCGENAESKHPLAKFCSRKCAQKFHNEQQSALDSIARATERGNGLCPTCSSVFTKTRSDQRHCSKRCTHVDAKRRMNFKLGHVPTPSKYRA